MSSGSNFVLIFLGRLSILLRAEFGTVSYLSFVFVRREAFSNCISTEIFAGLVKYTILTGSSHFVFMHQNQGMYNLHIHLKEIPF